MPPLPDLRDRKPELHQEPVAIHDDADRQPFVQLASLLSEPDAVREWQRLRQRMPDILGGHAATVTPADVAGKGYWRLRTFGFASSQEATNLCGRLMSAGWKCWTGRGL